MTWNCTHTRMTMLAISVLLVFLASVMSLGQGARREAPKPTPKPTSSKASPSRKPSTSRSSAPAFRPTNPNIELVKIPAGSLMMGSTKGDDDEKLVHQVTINYSFQLGKYEVTQSQWREVMGNNPSSNLKGCGNCPVDSVSWDDAQEFIYKLNKIDTNYTYRLPSEAEWEYACRAGTTGDYAGLINVFGWSANNAGGKTHPVGQLEANAFGLHDMHGNVWEWCEDWYHWTYGAPTDGIAWLSGGEQKYRVLRGGSALYSSALELRSANRHFDWPTNALEYYGFRVVAVARPR